MFLAFCPLAGWAGDGAVALQTADPSCPDNSGNIYVDCGNGTVTDNRTGLVWLKNADCLGTDVSWEMANAMTAGLSDLDPAFCSSQGLTANQCDCGLSDGSSAGEWRLPTAEEWRDMVADGKSRQCNPAITNDQGTGCWLDPLLCALGGNTCSFRNISSIYWASSPVVLAPGQVWVLQMSNGELFTNLLTGLDYVWPVRGGQ